MIQFNTIKTEQVNTATIGALSYTVGEYERFMAKDKETINDMKIKLKNALNTTKVETKTEVVFKEKLIYKPDSTVCFEFSDGWSSIDACLNRDSIAGTFKNREELFLVVHTKKQNVSCGGDMELK